MDRLVITSAWQDVQHADLILAGTLDAWGAGELARQFAGLVDAGARHQLVDLSGVRSWDARGTDALAATCQRLWIQGSLSVRGQRSHMLGGLDILPAVEPRDGRTATDLERAVT